MWQVVPHPTKCFSLKDANRGHHRKSLKSWSKTRPDIVKPSDESKLPWKQSLALAIARMLKREKMPEPKCRALANEAHCVFADCRLYITPATTHHFDRRNHRRSTERLHGSFFRPHRRPLRQLSLPHEPLSFWPELPPEFRPVRHAS